jgi:hypothetical protein
VAGDEIKVRILVKEGAIIFDSQNGNQCVNGGSSNPLPPQSKGNFGGFIPEGIGYWQPMEKLK